MLFFLFSWWRDGASPWFLCGINAFSFLCPQAGQASQPPPQLERLWLVSRLFTIGINPAFLGCSGSCWYINFSFCERIDFPTPLLSYTFLLSYSLIPSYQKGRGGWRQGWLFIPTGMPRLRACPASWEGLRFKSWRGSKIINHLQTLFCGWFTFWSAVWSIFVLISHFNPI